MQGRVALAEAGLKTASDRLAWSERMVAKGYASPAQVATDRAAVLRATHERSQARTDLDNFRLYRSETTIASLKAAYETAHWWSIHETGDYHKAQDLLDHYRDLVGHCTIRAPHDGFVIYANGSFRAEEDRWRIEQGAAVRQGQELFYFPDLSKMEILAMLHETVVDRIRPGMPARVRVEGLRGPATGGHVELVESFPKRSVIGEVPYYPCRITLDVTPAGLLPAMSAEVEIQVGRCRDVLAVPTEAVGVDHGRNFCDVIGPSGLERRDVTAGGSSSELIGVVAGLEEGETVVLNPEGVSDEHQPEE
jgi:HlyD family secretion protein